MSFVFAASSLVENARAATPAPTPEPTNDSEPVQSFQDTFFVLLIMGAEFVIVVTDRNRKKENTAGKQ
jgi:hypothetical protein